MAEYLGPWGNYLPLSGGTIFGDLSVTGDVNVLTNLDTVGSVIFHDTLRVDGVSTHNDTIIIVKDVAALGNPHIALRPATGAGILDIIENQSIAGVFESAFGSAFSLSLFLLTGVGGQFIAPLDLLESDPVWTIPLQVDSLGVRRTLMLHSLIFG